MTSLLRPDEKSSLSRIKANEERDSRLKQGGKAALSVATTFGGLAVASKILPFLNELLPVDLALKGISKVSPKIGNFLKRGMEQGLNVKDGLNFLREGINANQNKKEENKSNEPKTLQEAERIVALNKFNEKKKKSTLLEQERERFNQQYMPQEENQQMPQSQSNTDQALLAALEKILQM